MAKNPAARSQKTARYHVLIRGVVQGVGFRPFVYNLARRWAIKGSVLNTPTGVIIDAEGEEKNITLFLKEIQENPPRLSKITFFQAHELPVRGYTSFQILSSETGAGKDALVPPDVATCTECREEIFDKNDRHYAYPFTNCTNCGPRFTIIREIPYDRPNTAMAPFSMCSECAGEYGNPGNRRFHAQPVACPGCGPQVEVRDRNGKIAAGKENWLQKCWEIIQKGNILALKGLGGFHLTCDARNKEAIAALRQRKGRDAKPFAVMCRDLETAEKYCLLDKREREILSSPQAPIVILRRKPDAELPEELAPGLNTLGVMLPYTPLHLLLFSGPFDLLVMTSGNYSGLPLVKDNARALNELGQIADYFLLHNRDIVNRCDDSLVRVIDGETHIIRRSRGYVPHPIPVLRQPGGPVILGAGGEMKNCFCLLKNDLAFMSQYIGEIDSVEGEENLFASLINFQRLIGAVPEIVAYDAHPGYASARVARLIPAREYLAVQHHHAHFASCMAENGMGNEEAIGVILDGTGYGPDGTLWGFEIIAGSYTKFRRVIHLAGVPLPGGEIAIRQPWRTAAAYLIHFLGARGKQAAESIFKDKNLDVLEKMIVKGFNSPLSSGCGRLFDAVAAILGVCLENTYEGQAAIELGELIREDRGSTASLAYPYEIKNGVIAPGTMIAGIIKDRLSGTPAEIISTRFHNTVAAMVIEAVETVSLNLNLKKVVLSGGTWQNHYLFRLVKKTLEKRGYRVLYHRRVPANDGGIALGQAMIAHWRWLKKCV
ncbi:MAG: carbamoyltransferase HypF [Pelotomaculum sp.]|uniref:Carbamoyltransferase n=1 Tax=Pelotomaculum thermopropionicum (strain DSM 13744 / JCM 10971 / SI) TaxID=370438 RepID=A5D1K5_PELTS|nr:carbamoyltransferase HypF [Pelotomaculum sp.]BAF59877.1 hydrogenase maturation factor [Pelotomaculum thermopropionicum SI]